MRLNGLSLFSNVGIAEAYEDYHSLVRQRWNAIGNRYR